jgi:GDP-mannose 6-dehydrogenase
LTHRAQEVDVSLPVLDAVIPSNDRHVDLAMDLLRDLGKRKVGLLGLSFKPGTDDLRESPLVTLAEKLIGKGYDLQVYDPLVNIDHLVGANKTYILREIPHISRLMAPSLDALIRFAEVVVIGNGSPEFQCLEEKPLAGGQVLVDLAGLLKGKAPAGTTYHGICW